MTITDLVARVKLLPADTSAIQVEKFVTELLGKPKRTDLMMVRMYRRKVLTELKRLRD